MLRKAYLKRIGQRLEYCEDEISTLRDKAGKLEANSRKSYQEQLEVLRRRQNVARDRVRELSDAGAASWGTLKAGVEESVDDLKKAVENAIENLRKIA
jgi:hypothetical protein